jgi:hypothetical protein
MKFLITWYVTSCFNVMVFCSFLPIFIILSWLTKVICVSLNLMLYLYCVIFFSMFFLYNNASVWLWYVLYHCKVITGCIKTKSNCSKKHYMHPRSAHWPTNWITYTSVLQPFFTHGIPAFCRRHMTAHHKTPPHKMSIQNYTWSEICIYI